ncbi:hypothetical protein DFH09DRAFT_1493869 [Mycena vulgaris]|nr:hypothetical protein DFH09DRAFT_1493869 [Mycena vulgaris]
MSGLQMELETDQIWIFPDELWLRIFTAIHERKSLTSVIFVSHRFYALGMEALLRHITWKNSTAAMKHLDFWHRHPDRRTCVRALTLNYHEYGGKTPYYMGIKPSKKAGNALLSAAQSLSLSATIESFTMLTHLTFSRGFLPDSLYESLQRLPNLTHLTIKYCCVPVPPHSTHLTIQATHLSAINLYTVSGPLAGISASLVARIAQYRGADLPYARSYDTQPHPDISPHFIHLLPRLNTLTASRLLPHDISDVTAGQLTSHTVAAITVNDEMIVSEIRTNLQRMPQLTRLHVGLDSLDDSSHFNYRPLRPLEPAGSFPQLLSVYAPLCLVACVIPGANALTRVVIQEPIFTPDAFDLITALAHLPFLRTFALSLLKWDEKVLVHIAKSLPRCERLELLYSQDFAGPTKRCLRVLGQKHLSRLPALRAFHLHLRPPYRSWFERTSDSSSDWEDDEPEDEKLKEYVISWSAHNPTLKRVKLGFEWGKSWGRHGDTWVRWVKVDDDQDNWGILDSVASDEDEGAKA